MNPQARALWTGAWVVAIVATGTSLWLSGIGPINWHGKGLFPCELCWYQRILMYPLAILLGVGVVRRAKDLAFWVFPLAGLGLFIAGYHVVLQAYPAAEAGRCIVGSCTSVEYRFPWGFTIPQMSALAFTLILATGGLATWLDRLDEH